MPLDQTSPDLRTSLPAHFRMVEMLAEGAFGAILGAVDAEGQHVAVKVLAPAVADQPEAAWLFATEFRRLRRLHHPAFPRAFEEGRTLAGLPYYTMQLIEGESPLARAPLPAGQIRELLLALAEALSYLHAMGLVHGDLKPENLKIAPDGRLYLLDVGLMAMIGQRREAIQGTLEYLAPEVFRKAPIDARSDLYALGVLGYQLWTGQLPFRGSPPELVRAHLQQAPADVASMVSDPDPGLAQLIMGLLVKDPATRPATAEAVLEALGRPAAPEVPRLLSGTFVGRSGVLEAWRQAIASRNAHCWSLQGPWGYGKSRTLDEWRCEAELAGWSWVGTVCTGSSVAPGSPMRAVVNQALRAAELPIEPPLSAWLKGEVPAEWQEMPPNALKWALQSVAIQALEEAARKLGGLAVGMDDWHLSDSASRGFFQQARQMATGAPIAWVLAGETSEGAPAEASTIMLAPLSDQDARELLSKRLGADCPPELADQILPLAAGCPLFLDLLLEHMVATGQVRRRESGWEVQTMAPSSGVSTSLATLFEERLRHLPGAARKILELASLALPAGELPGPIFGQILGLEAIELADAFDTLLSEGLLTGSEGRFRLGVPALAELLDASTASSQREQWAAHLAQTLLGNETDPAGVPAEALIKAAWLAQGGPDDELAVRLACEAGRRMLVMFDPAGAYRLLGLAAKRLEHATPAQRLSASLTLAEAERFLDRLDEAIPDYLAAIELSERLGEAPMEAKALNGLAKCRQMKGDYAEALRLVQSVHARAQGNPLEATRALLAEARLRLFEGATPAAIACCEQAGAMARSEGLTALLAQALNLHGALIVQEDLDQADMALGLLHEALALSDRLGDRLGMGQTLDNLGNAYLAQGDLRQAREAFERYGAICRDIGAATEAISADLNRTLVLVELGDPAGASLGAEVAERAASVGRKFPQGAALAVTAQARWRASQFEAARVALDEALAIAADIKNRYLEEHVRLYRLETLLAAGDRSAAHEEAERLGALVAATGHMEASHRLTCHRAELARQQGDLEAAEALAREALPCANRWVAHRANQLLARIALTRNLGETARDHAQAALAISRDWGAVWHVQSDLLALALAEQLLGRRAEGCALARELLAMEPVNPFARGGASLLLSEMGEQDGAWLQRAAWNELPGLHGMSAEASGALLSAWGISGLRAPTRGVAASGVMADPAWLCGFANSLAQARDESQIGAVLLETVMRVSEAERGYLLLYEKGRLREAITRGLDYQAEVETGFSTSIAEHVLLTGDPVYLTDARADGAWNSAASILALDLRTVICLPFMTPERIVGVLCVNRAAMEPVLSPADLSVLTAAATMAATAYVRESGRRHAEQRAAQHQRCLELGARLAAAPAAEAPRILLAACMDAIEGEHGYLLARGEAGGWHACLALKAGRELVGPAALRFSQSIANWVSEHREALCLLDAGSEEAWQDRQSVLSLGLRTVFCVPLDASRDLLLYVDSPRIEESDPDACLQSLQSLIDHAARLGATSTSKRRTP